MTLTIGAATVEAAVPNVSSGAAAVIPVAGGPTTPAIAPAY